MNNKLDVIHCYSVAWKSFSKWWIPLCLVSGLLFFMNVLPQLFMISEIKGLKDSVFSSITAMQEKDVESLELAEVQLHENISNFLKKAGKAGIFALPVIALLAVILLNIANQAVKNRREPKKSVLFLLYITCVHFVLAVLKVLFFLFLIFPGVYIYIKLLFVLLIMLEEKRGAVDAIKTSWRMTKGNFKPLFLLILLNVTVQIAAASTIVGLIPATGFVNTARAAAFRNLWERYREIPQRINSDTTDIQEKHRKT